MRQKFVPNADGDFVVMAERFAATVARRPERYAVSVEESVELSEKVKTFRAAFQLAASGGRSSVATAAKRLARAEAEEVVRLVANRVRADKRLDPLAKVELGIKARSERVRVVDCPREAPRLRFVRALHEGNGVAPRHELRFERADGRAGRPTGAVRLELFVDLVEPDAAVPGSPGEAAVRGGFAGRAWYWRSYTKSPVVVEPPLAGVPMRVVYWARWAGASGDVGPFSATAAGWVEGGSPACLPGGVGVGFGATPGVAQQTRRLLEAVRGGHDVAGLIAGSGEEVAGVAGRAEQAASQRYVVTLMQAQLKMLEATVAARSGGDVQVEVEAERPGLPGSAGQEDGDDHRRVA